jgi:hypothetical protein
MRPWPIALIFAAVGLAACGGLSLSGSPAAVAPDSNAANDTFGGNADVFVVSGGRAADHSGSDDIRVEAVSAEGRRTLAAFDATAGLALGTRLNLDSAMLVSPRGFLTVGIEGGITGPLEEVEPARRLIFDLRDVTRPPLVVPDGSVSWGPDNRLAIVGAPGVTFVDPMNGDAVVPFIPAWINLETVWAADGSGLLASRLDSKHMPIQGIFSPDGTFAEWAGGQYSSTGLGRQYGASGLVMTDTTFIDADATNDVILLMRPDREGPVEWLSNSTGDPGWWIIDHTWDAAGVGRWVLLGHGDEASLIHLTGPNATQERARFAATTEPSIIGVAADDAAVVIAMAASENVAARMLLIDTTTGVVTRIDGVGNRSQFAGWAVIR